jgi:O-antigen ligase
MSMSLLTIFIISYFLHLSARIPVLGAMRFDLLLGFLILISIFLSKTDDKWRTSIETAKKLNVFLFYVFLSLPLVTWPGSVIRNNLVDWVKAAMFFIFIVAIVRTERQLKWIILVFLACQAFRILEPLYLHVATGYWGDIAYSHVGGKMTGLDRLSGAPFDVVNPNQLAWIIVTIAPFLFYLFWQGGKIGKLLFISSAFPFLYCLLLTGSRSGLSCLVFTILAMIMMSERKLRNFTVAAIVLIPAAIYFSGSLSTDMQTRYLSLVDSSLVGADTAQGRTNTLIKQLSSLSHNPLFGNGLGTSREANVNILGDRRLMTHNLYLELLQEVGIVGFAIFILFIFSLIRSLREAKRHLKERGASENDWIYRLVIATQVWVAMDLFYSLACFGLSSWEWYFFGGVSTLSLALARERANETSSPIGATIQDYQKYAVAQNAGIYPSAQIALKGNQRETMHYLEP